MEMGSRPKNFPLYVFVLLGVVIVGIGTLWFIGRAARETDQLAYENDSPFLDLYNELDLSEEENKGLARLLVKIDTGVPSKNTLALTQNIVEELESDVPSQKGDIKKTLENTLRDATGQNESYPASFYEIANLNIIVAPQEADRERYAKNIEDLLRSIYYKGLTLELQYFLDGYGISKSPEIKKEMSLKLLRAGKAYEALASGLMTLDVPVDKSSRHMEMANAYLALSVGCKLFAESLADTALGVNAYRIYIYGHNILSQK